MATLNLNIEGKLGRISALALAAVLQKSIGVLQDIDRRVSEQKRGSVDWLIKDVSAGSVSFDLITANLPGVKGNGGERTLDCFTKGFKQIAADGGTPPYFSQANVSALLDVSRLIGRRTGVQGINYHALRRDIVLTPEIQKQLGQLVGKSYQAIGSIEGLIEVVSLKRGKRHFNITHARTLRSIKCALSPDLEATVFNAARDHRRVLAFGKIAYNIRNEPISLTLTRELRLLGLPGSLPRSADLGGSDRDISEGPYIEDYVRSLSNG